MDIIHLTKANFEQQALHCEKPVLLDFYADWCGPCRKTTPTINEIARENDAIQVCKVNVDESPEIAAQYDVLSIPTFVILKNGKEYQRAVGALNKNEILRLFQ